jgi:hypothetical protein
MGPPPEIFSRLSLLSFVSSFEDGKSFNETDLATLGLDLQCDKPLLPMLHSVLSDAPLLNHSCHPIPESYKKVAVSGMPLEKVKLFSDETLMFIFATEAQTRLQSSAADELTRRGLVFDEERGRWQTQSGREWNMDLWKETEGGGRGMVAGEDRC